MKRIKIKHHRIHVKVKDFYNKSKKIPPEGTIIIYTETKVVEDMNTSPKSNSIKNALQEINSNLMSLRNDFNDFKETTNERFNKIEKEMHDGFDKVNKRIDETNERIDKTNKRLDFIVKANKLKDK